MFGYFLKNANGKYIKDIDTYNGTLTFTKSPSEAKNYRGMPGGGRWDAENELIYLQRHFSEYKELETMTCISEEY